MLKIGYFYTVPKENCDLGFTIQITYFMYFWQFYFKGVETHVFLHGQMRKQGAYLFMILRSVLQKDDVLSWHMNAYSTATTCLAQTWVPDITDAL